MRQKKNPVRDMQCCVVEGLLNYKRSWNPGSGGHSQYYNVAQNLL